ncbi:unnamed protein product [Amoebophrya sp. A25]|nr:unnamed protein product [Amoebophrya sp. A25]|eukprot:GSA25T00003865001.1
MSSRYHGRGGKTAGHVLRSQKLRSFSGSPDVWASPAGQKASSYGTVTPAHMKASGSAASYTTATGGRESTACSNVNTDAESAFETPLALSPMPRRQLHSSGGTNIATPSSTPSGTPISPKWSTRVQSTTPKNFLTPKSHFSPLKGMMSPSPAKSASKSSLLKESFALQMNKLQQEDECERGEKNTPLVSPVKIAPLGTPSPSPTKITSSSAATSSTPSTSSATTVSSSCTTGKCRAATSIPYPKKHGHNDLRQIFGVRYNPNAHRAGDNYVAVGYADGALRVFQNDSWCKVATCPSEFDTPDPETLKLIEKGIQVSAATTEPNDPITSLKWLDSKRILFLQGSQINILNMEQPSRLQKVEHNHGTQYVCDVTHNGTDLAACKRPQRFLVGGTDRKVVIYDAKTLQETCCLKKSLYLADSFAHSNRISAAKFFPDCDGQIYVTGSWDNSVGVWDCRSGKRERFVEESLMLVGSGPEALDVDRNMILTGSYRTRNAVQLFDFGTCKLVESIQLNEDMLPYTCQFSRDSKRIFVGGKICNASGQGSFVTIRRGSPRSVITYEDHKRGAAVWSIDAHLLGDGVTEYALGHADGVIGVMHS